MKLRKGSKRRAHGELAGPWTPIKAPQISFTEEDEAGIHYPHCDALMVRMVVARNGLGRMDADHELTAISEPLFGFTENSPVPRRRITLAVDFREPPCHLRKFIEFLIVDTCSAYHGVLGRHVLKDL
ncbi:Ribonuclease H [Abeliophyllum distichum]|uniref:Ribonuclease H n=1 Tax=Abeliophyllum distichum TaxID=126358 RepID=A0ABD1P275_9LAMI